MFGFDCSNLTIHNSIKEIEIVNKAINNKFKYVVICPGGNWKPKLWPVNNFNRVIKIINKEFTNVKFIIVGSVSEKEYYYENVIKDINKELIFDLMGESLTLTSAFMKKCNLFIGNDSGLMHLSAASNLKTIGLFGPTNDKIYAPKGKNCFVIRTKESYEYFEKNIEDSKKSCMKSIEIEEVINLIKINKLL